MHMKYKVAFTFLQDFKFLNMDKIFDLKYRNGMFH